MNENSLKLHHTSYSNLKSNKQKANPKKKYQNISVEQRIQLLNRILSKEVTIKQAAQECNIILSTAKVILQTYRKKGQIGKKKNREKRQRTIRENNFHQKILIINNSKAIKKTNTNFNKQTCEKILCQFKLLNSVQQRNENEKNEKGCQFKIEHEQQKIITSEQTSLMEQQLCNAQSNKLATVSLNQLTEQPAKIENLLSCVQPSCIYQTVLPMNYAHYTPQFLYPKFFTLQKFSTSSFIY